MAWDALNPIGTLVLTEARIVSITKFVFIIGWGCIRNISSFRRSASSSLRQGCFGCEAGCSCRSARLIWGLNSSSWNHSYLCSPTSISCSRTSFSVLLQHANENRFALSTKLNWNFLSGQALDGLIRFPRNQATGSETRLHIVSTMNLNLLPQLTQIDRKDCVLYYTFLTFFWIIVQDLSQ